MICLLRGIRSNESFVSYLVLYTSTFDEGGALKGGSGDAYFIYKSLPLVYIRFEWPFGEIQLDFLRLPVCSPAHVWSGLINKRRGRALLSLLRGENLEAIRLLPERNWFESDLAFLHPCILLRLVRTLSGWSVGETYSSNLPDRFLI